MQKNIKRNFILLLIIAIIIIPFKNVQAKGITRPCVFLELGNTYNFSTSKTKNWTWKSSKPYIASVKNGKVTGNDLGYVTITAKKGNQTYSWYIKVTYSPPFTGWDYIEDLSSPKGISHKSLTLATKDCKEIFLNKIKGNVIWSVSNNKVIELEPQGTSCYITPKKTGIATIKATVNGKIYSCKVTVIKGEIKVSKNAITLEIGQTRTITVTSDDTFDIWYDHDILACKWGKSSGNKSILNITGLKEDETFIYFKTEHSNESQSVDIIVEKANNPGDITE